MKSTNESNKRLTSDLGFIAIAAILLHSLGFLTTRLFIVVLKIPDGFLSESPTDYLLWGAKAIVPIIIYVIFFAIFVTCIILLFLLFRGLISWVTRRIINLCIRLSYILPKQIHSILGRLVRFIVKKNQITKERIDKKWTSFWQNRGLSSISGGLFILSILSISFFYINYSKVIDICIGLSDDTTIFKSNTFNYFYSPFLTLLLILLLLGLFKFTSYYRNRREQSSILVRVFITGTIGIILICLGFLVMPYRLIYHNKFEEFEFNHQHAFIISKKNSELLIYIPSTKETFVVDQNNSEVNRSDKRVYKNIFDFDDSYNAKRKECPK